MQSGEGRFQVRKLEISDKSKGFVELLQQLTICDSVSDKDFEDRFQELAALGDDHVIGVIEDDKNGKIIASGSVFIEKKFIRNCGKVGHIEDVVVDFNARGMQLGKKVIEFLVDHARSVGCYKVILDCSDENREFYKKCGFDRKEIQMVSQSDINSIGNYLGDWKPPSPSMNTGRGISSFSTTVTTTVTLDNSAAASTSSSQPRQPETLVIRLNPRKKKVTWKEGTVDNEFMQKKSSKKCCIFHKEKPFDEDDSDGDDDGYCDHRLGDAGPCCSNNNGAESSATPSH